MKKKLWLPIIILALVLFLPIPTGTYKDGGTREYTALTYKIVRWNRLTESTTGIYSATKVYFFPKNFRSYNKLWEEEKMYVEHSFVATILEINGTNAIVQPTTNKDGFETSDLISFDISKLENIDVSIGSVVNIIYLGEATQDNYLQVNATSWSISSDLRHLEYTEPWLDKETSEKLDYPLFDSIIITEIYSNCFFARTVVPFPYEIKINGKLADDWCVGDKVICTYENGYIDEDGIRVEADMLSIAPSTFTPDPNVCYKPVIYLYPSQETNVSVQLELNGKLTCTYPTYNNGWLVTALPDGTLLDENNQTYNYLYWEGEINAQFDFSKGFCVKGEDTASFLEVALANLGLNRQEANEFIVYWLAQMQQNPYNIISFQSDVYYENAKLIVSPNPDTLIRVFMAFKASDTYVEIEKQELTPITRNGFTVVEWGGGEVK